MGYVQTVAVNINTILTQTHKDFSMVDRNLRRIPSRKIPKDATRIDLSTNKISQINAADFVGLDSLQSLILADNQLTSVPDLTHVVDTLLCLDLSSNQITMVDAEDFEGFLVLKELSLKSNHLTTLPNLTHIAGTLVKLVLSKNTKLQPHIPTDYFTGFDVLEQLEIETIKLFSFPNLNPLSKTLTHLNVIGNKFSSIPIQNIQNFTRLTEFNFAHNNLGNIPEIAEGIENSLLFLSAVKCNISGAIPAETFIGFHSLEAINISQNAITEFPDFKYVATTLKLIRIEKALISHVPWNLLNQLIAVEYLNLGHNKLRAFYPAIGPALSMKNLRLNDNKLTSVPIISTMAVNLELYRVYSNNITEIPPESLVFLNRNQSVPFELLVHDTLIETIPPVVGPNINNVTVRFDNVPLVCDVKIAWLVLLPNAMRELLQGSCHMPAELHGIALINLTMDDLQSKQKDQEDKVPAYVYSHGKLLVKDLYSNTLPMLTVFTPSVHKCVHLCARVQGCLYINYYKELIEQTDEYLTKGNCHYASPYEGTKYDKPDDATGWTYYNINTK